MKDHIHKNIQSLDYKSKHFSDNEKSLEKAQAGHQPLKNTS